jgi:hypothetical protein
MWHADSKPPIQNERKIDGRNVFMSSLGRPRLAPRGSDYDYVIGSTIRRRIGPTGNALGDLYAPIASSPPTRGDNHPRR